LSMQIASSVRERTPIRSKICVRVFLTVLIDRPSSLAISLLVAPVDTSKEISHSRGVSLPMANPLALAFAGGFDFICASPKEGCRLRSSTKNRPSAFQRPVTQFAPSSLQCPNWRASTRDHCIRQAAAPSPTSRGSSREAQRKYDYLVLISYSSWPQESKADKWKTQLTSQTPLHVSC
jgi:hypothetical protein